MCEICDFHSVDDYNSALEFIRKYILTRLENLLLLHKKNKFEDFIERYKLPSFTFKELLVKFTEAYKLILDYEGWEVSHEKFLEKLCEMEIQFILFGVEQHFSDGIKQQIEEQKTKFSKEEIGVTERLCNLLYNIDCDI